jgi:hypothetical protein
MATNHGYVEPTKAQLVNMCDIGTILGLPCVLPMLESISALMKFAYARDVFVCDYIIIVKICQANLYKMYIDPTISFQHENFLEFTNVVANTSCRITHDWVTNLNDNNEHLAFCIIKQSHMVHFIIALINEHSPVILEHFDQVIKVVKVHYIATCVLLILELEWRFLDHELMNVFRIVYPQY